jgi:uncharacterized protein YjgD (DUF1641 family)
MEQALAELNQKIDLLTAQVQFLTEEAGLAQRQRQERAELMHDAMPIIDEAYRLSVDQLEEVEQYIDLGDLLRILKRLLRNGRNLEVLLDQLESVLDLVKTVGPLTDSAFSQLVDLLQEAEARGYVAFGRGAVRVVDSIVKSISEEELRSLATNIAPLLSLLKQAARPEILQLAQNTVTELGEAGSPDAGTSLRALARQLGDPDVRRGLALTLRVLGALGAGYERTQRAAPSRHSGAR